MEQDTQQEPITPESSPPSSSLKEITEHSKDSYLHLYIRAMSEIGNPNHRLCILGSKCLTEVSILIKILTIYNLKFYLNLSQDKK